MSTRCLIGLERDNNNVEFIYCHFDGYPEGVGSMLKSNYYSVDGIESLLELGDMRALKRNLEESIFYARDVGEDFEDVASAFISKNDYFSEQGIACSEYRYLLTETNDLVCYDVDANDFIDII